MSEWWTYTPSDLLLFSPRVYYRLLELHNLAVWPLQLLTALLALAIICLVLKPGRLSDRLVPLGLGVVWIWVAWSFLWDRYATINWAAAYVAPFYAVEGLLLVWTGASSDGLSLAANRKAPLLSGLGLLALALFGYPIVAPAMGRSWTAAEIFGITPDPTATATLAVLAISRRSVRWLLMIIPFLWCLITGATLWAMGAADFFTAPLIGLAAFGIALVRQSASGDEDTHRRVLARQ
jgi:hypothetical protein